MHIRFDRSLSPGLLPVSSKYYQNAGMVPTGGLIAYDQSDPLVCADGRA
jgi:hypothetical protein